MTKKITRFYTTINEAKQLMKLSIYERWIKDKADMFWGFDINEYFRKELNIHTGQLADINNPFYTPAWSTDALIKVCNDLGLVLYIDAEGLSVTKFSPDHCHIEFQHDINGTNLPWMLVKVLKEYDKEYGTK